MRSAKSRRVLITAAVAVVVLFATAVTALAISGTRHFGYHKVREGLPKHLAHLSVTSTDLRAHKPIPQKFWGCTSAGVSPQLSWEGAPAATKSYVVTMFDPDAPTGSGFWHWVAWDIPASTHSLPTGATLPSGAVNGENDGGTLGYTGPCPPVGDRTHHYHITVVALDVSSIGVPATTRSAVVGFITGAHALAAGQLVATAKQ
jgi:Raf kinase inhibitor-like YbhB/YbcL family protein